MQRNTVPEGHYPDHTPPRRGGKMLGLSFAAVFFAVAALLLASGSARADLYRTSNDAVEANGRVSDILKVGNVVYLGGSFTEITDIDGTVVQRNNFAAVDANTGALLPDFAPSFNGSVRTIELSADGTKLYAGGSFTRVNEQVRNRLAAVNAMTGELDRKWIPGTNGVVWTLAVKGESVYIGGNFVTIKGQPRNRLAKVDGANAVLDASWSPSADQTNKIYGSVRAMKFAEDGSEIFVAGYFKGIDGENTGNLVALDPSTGARDTTFNPYDANGLQSLAVGGGMVYAGSGDDLEGVEAFDASTGNLKWYLGPGDHAAPRGDVQALEYDAGTLYAGGHFTRLGDQNRSRIAAIDAATGTIDSKWLPTLNNMNLGVWAIEAEGDEVYAGGDFTSVTDRPQARFARFSQGPDRPVRGLTGEYYDTKDFTDLKMTRTDLTVNYDWGSYAPPPGTIGNDTFSIRWTGRIMPQYSERYDFYTVSDDGVRLWVNGQLVINNWSDHAPKEDSGAITLAAGKLYDIKMEYYENGGGAQAKLLWSSPSTPKAIVPQGRLYPAPSVSPTPTTP